MEHLTAIDKAVEVLFHLRGQPGAVGVTEIGRALALPKSSAHRLLSSLRRRDLVERDPGGRYRLGVGLLALGLGALEQDPVVLAGRPVLEAQASELGETFFLVGARAGGLVVLAKAEGTGLLRAAPRVGASIPVHATAVGKLYVAHAPEQLAPVDAGGEPFTGSTLDAACFAAAVADARREGFARNDGEWVEGLAVWAAPVFLHGRLAGAVATALPSGRLGELSPTEVAARVVAAARAIEARADGRHA